MLNTGIPLPEMKPGSAQTAIVRRVDPAVGLLVELPAQAVGEPEADPNPDLDPASALPPPREKGDKRRGGKKKAARAAKRLAAAAAPGAGGARSGTCPPLAAAGYAHISSVSDAKVDRLEKARWVFKRFCNEPSHCGHRAWATE